MNEKNLRKIYGKIKSFQKIMPFSREKKDTLENELGIDKKSHIKCNRKELKK